MTWSSHLPYLNFKCRKIKEIAGFFFCYLFIYCFFFYGSGVEWGWGVAELGGMHLNAVWTVGISRDHIVI